MNLQPQHGLFVVTDTPLPVLDTQTLANDIVARIERDFAQANRPQLAAHFIEHRRDTPLSVLRRVLYSAYSSTFNA